MRWYDSKSAPIAFASASAKLALAALATAVLFGIVFALQVLFSQLPWAAIPVQVLAIPSVVFLTTAVVLAALAALTAVLVPDVLRIRTMVRRGLFCSAYGNPLHLRDGDVLPKVRCKRVGPGLFDIRITTGSVTAEDLVAVAPSISSSLNGRRFRRYAVIQPNADLAFGYVDFRVENVLVDKSFVFHAAEDMRPEKPTLLSVQEGTFIDLTSSGSMLFAGKTRSGKTTGVIALLIQVLLLGRDGCYSEVLIVDPKRAELSRLPHVVTLDVTGEATQILAALQHFEATILERQQRLNDLSEAEGDAVHWWEAGFHPSFLFIDEYVACRTIFPKKATKDDPDYCLEAFDGLIKRIITMGASAGCFAIISIAEASVQEGGLPSMLRSAMSTRVLFRPTLPEGRLIWDGSNEKLKNFAVDRVYRPGDAWFSSTDGIHDMVSYVHFPRMTFRVYHELGRLLKAYYAPPLGEAKAAVPESKQR